MTSSRSALALFAFAGMTSLLALQFLHIRVEPVEALREKAAIVAQPSIGLSERRRVEAHRAELRLTPARDEPCPLEHLEMLGHGGLAETRWRHELVDGGLAGGEPGKDRAAGRIGQRGEDEIERRGGGGDHTLPFGYILIWLYRTYSQAVKAGIGLGPHVSAQTTRPIRVLVGFAAGGGNDVIARLLAQKMGESASGQVLVDNKTGASGLIAADILAKAPADGTTLMVAAQTTYAVAPQLYKSVAFDAPRDVAGIS